MTLACVLLGAISSSCINLILKSIYTCLQLGYEIHWSAEVPLPGKKRKKKHGWQKKKKSRKQSWEKVMGLQNAYFGPLIWLKPRSFRGLHPWTPGPLDPIRSGLHGKPLNRQISQKIFISWLMLPDSHFFPCAMACKRNELACAHNDQEIALTSLPTWMGQIVKTWWWSLIKCPSWSHLQVKTKKGLDWKLTFSAVVGLVLCYYHHQIGGSVYIVNWYGEVCA